jgi:hypothetical protein
VENDTSDAAVDASTAAQQITQLPQPKPTSDDTRPFADLRGRCSEWQQGAQSGQSLGKHNVSPCFDFDVAK